MNKIHLLIILFLICLGQSAQAQYYSVNYDKKTVAAMAAAYNTEAATEAYYNEQVQNILKHYNAAEVATAGIFASTALRSCSICAADNPVSLITYSITSS